MLKNLICLKPFFSVHDSKNLKFSTNSAFLNGKNVCKHFIVLEVERLIPLKVFRLFDCLRNSLMFDVVLALKNLELNSIFVIMQ